jgi:hypothetical protein
MSMATIHHRIEKAMAGTIRARVGRGVLKLLGKNDIPAGTEVSVTILETPAWRDLRFTHFQGGSGDKAPSPV